MDAIASSLKANRKTLELLDQAANIEHCLWPRKLEKLKEMTSFKPTELKPMTKENRKRLWEEISDFLKKGERGDE